MYSKDAHQTIKIRQNNGNRSEMLNPFPLITCYTLFNLALQEDGKSGDIQFEPKENIREINEFFKNSNNIDQVVDSSLINDLLTNLIYCAINEFENENMVRIDLMNRILNVYKLFEQFLSTLEHSYLYTPNLIFAQLIYPSYLLWKRMNERIKGCVNMIIVAIT